MTERRAQEHQQGPECAHRVRVMTSRAINGCACQVEERTSWCIENEKIRTVKMVCWLGRNQKARNDAPIMPRTHTTPTSTPRTARMMHILPTCLLSGSGLV